MTSQRTTPFRAGRAEGESSDLHHMAALEVHPAFSGNHVLMADVSEFQPDITDGTYARDFSQAIIIRAAYGDAHDDRAWYGGARRHDLHQAGIKFLGIYQYIVAGQDPAAQARELARLIGKLEPGEVPIGDFEEGAGSQNDRRNTWAHVIEQELGWSPWDYSGEIFASSHGLAPVDWVAAYRNTEPSATHLIWQFTDAFSIPGVGTADCSVFHGTIDQLTAHAYGSRQQANPTDWTTEAIMALPTIKQGDKDRPGDWFRVTRAQALVRAIGQVNQLPGAQSLAVDGSFGAATTAGVKAVQKHFGLTQDGVIGRATWTKLIGS